MNKLFPRIALLALTCVPVIRAGAPQLKFGRTFEASSIGLSFRAPNQAKPVTLPPPQLYYYKDQAGNRYEMYDQRDLWFRTQYAGHWAGADNDNATLTLGMLRYPMPTGFKHPHVSHDEFQQAADTLAAPDRVWNLAGIKAWAAAFSGVAVDIEPREIKRTMRLAQVYEFRYDDCQPAKLGYAFRMKSNRLLHVDGDQWYFALLQLPPDTDPEQAALTAQRDFLNTLQPTARTTDAARSARITFQHKDTAPSTDKSVAFQRSRERMIQSIEGAADWWFVETDHYILVSDLPSSRRSLVLRIQEDIERLREAYMCFSPPRVPIEEISVIRVFARHEDFVQYVGEEFEWAAGLWMPAKKELVMHYIEGGRRHDEKERLLRTVYHEAWHQYLHYAYDRIMSSAWFDEGHAEFFEGVKFERRRIKLEETPYVTLLQAMIRANRADIARLLNMTHEQYYAINGTQQERLEHHALAWGLIYYLRKAAPLRKEKDYAEILTRYKETLWQTRDHRKATAVAFKDIDLSAFIHEFADFFRSNHQRSKARRNELFE